VSARLAGCEQDEQEVDHMINSVRIWTRKPARPFFAAIEKEERTAPRKEAREREGFFNSFFQMWEHQANLAIRNLND
jgi:hypothetical protein